jgi:hypothetical protein
MTTKNWPRGLKIIGKWIFKPHYIIKRLSEKFNICYNRRATDISRFRRGWLIKMSWIAFKKIKWIGKKR